MCKRIVIPKEYINSSASNYYEEIDIQTWKEAERVLELFSNEWIFRGQNNATWDLVPSIERKTAFASPDDLDRIVIDALKAGMKDSSLPKTNLGWLAFAQHHGGITRLLDFTTDYYIAVFFALALDQGISVFPQRCAIWAVNKNWCIKCTHEKLANFYKKNSLDVQKMHPATFFDKAFIFNPDFELCVYPFVSDWMTERMIRQKSIFLCKCDPSDSFDVNLSENNYHEAKDFIKKITLPNAIRDDVEQMLNKRNINREQLLPGDEKFTEMRDAVKKFEDHARLTIEELRKKGR